MYIAVHPHAANAFLMSLSIEAGVVTDPYLHNTIQACQDILVSALSGS